MEREVQHEPEVIEGEDVGPRRPDAHGDFYVPEPGPRPGEDRAFNVLRWAWVPVAIVVAVVVWALFA